MIWFLDWCGSLRTEPTRSLFVNWSCATDRRDVENGVGKRPYCFLTNNTIRPRNVRSTVLTYRSIYLCTRKASNFEECQNFRIEPSYWNF